jgi:hypothetical protein
MLAQTIIVTDNFRVANRPSAGGSFTVAGAGIGASGTEQRNATRAGIQSIGGLTQDGKFPLDVGFLLSKILAGTSRHRAPNV